MVISCILRPLVLQQLHSTHMGIVKTKGFARSYVWWPRIDNDVEALCRECETCALEGDSTAAVAVRVTTVDSVTHRLFRPVQG